LYKKYIKVAIPKKIGRTGVKESERGFFEKRLNSSQED
jgi:hypothetical protein